MKYMDTPNSLPAAREFAGTADSHAQARTLCWTLAGFGLGGGAAWAYLLLGGEYAWNIPRWALIVFYPGFLAGFKVNEWGGSKNFSIIVGIVTVGLAYALIALLVRVVWLAWMQKKRSGRNSLFDKTSLLAPTVLPALLAGYSDNRSSNQTVQTVPYTQRIDYRFETGRRTLSAPIKPLDAPTLQQACGADADLRRQADSLLAAHDRAGQFLRPTVAPSAPNALVGKSG